MVEAVTQESGDWTAMSWNDIVRESQSDTVLSSLREVLTAGFPDKINELPDVAKVFWNYRMDLSLLSDGVILYGDRIVIPKKLQRQALDILHSAHQGVSGMSSRAQAVVSWPGISRDIQTVRDQCPGSCSNAPSQAKLPAVEPKIPSLPFESIFADFFELASHHYLVAGDRLSGWVEVFSSKVGSKDSGSAGLISHLRRFFATFGVPNELSSDGGSEFISSATESFLARWGVHHRTSSSYLPQSNGRAELAVKKVKRFLPSCINTRSGSLDTDQFLRGMLQIRNTPDADCKLSPAEIVFGRPLRDAFSFINHQNKFDNPHVRPVWREAWAAKENALRARFIKSMENCPSSSHMLPTLSLGQHVFVQNQTGVHPNKWDRSGTIVEIKPHDQYVVKMDGSNRLSLRNRRFLRHFTLPSFSAPNTTHLASDTSAGHVSVPLSSRVPQPVLPEANHVILNKPQSTSETSGQNTDLMRLPEEPVAPATVIPTPNPPSLPAQLPTAEDLSPSLTASLPAAGESSVSPASSTRPRRALKPTKKYVPETGQWE